MKHLALNHTSKTNILDLFVDWLHLEAAQGEPSQNTLTSYLSSVRCFLKWCGSAGIDAIFASEQDIKWYRANLVAEGYKRSTIAARLVGIRRLYDALISWEWRAENPVANVRAKSDLTSHSDRILEKYISDRDAFLNLCFLPDIDTEIGIRDRAILRLLCYTGIRVSELCAMNLEDLDLGDIPNITIRSGKGRKRRQIPISEDDRSFLRRWCNIRCRYIGENERSVFVSMDNRSRGTRLSTRGARYIVDKYLKMAGLKIPGRSCHSLRHSTATWLLAAGVPMEAISDILGHSSVKVTAIYAKVVNRRKYIPSTMLSKKIRELLGLYTIKGSDVKA